MGAGSTSALVVICRLALRPKLTRLALQCLAVILRDFFWLQYQQALTGRSPVYNVDHAMDDLVPFDPRYVDADADFSAFWLRALGHLMNRQKDAEVFLCSIADVYRRVAAIYRLGFSTTTRPRFYRGKFLVIHAFDPHSMCVSSLHVVLMIRTFTKFRAAISETDVDLVQLSAVERGAYRITESVLFVKQHSVNCIPAAMYAMTCDDPVFFSRSAGHEFVQSLFQSCLEPNTADKLRSHIVCLSDRWLDEWETCESWTEPLVNFLREHPRAETRRLFAALT